MGQRRGRVYYFLGPAGYPFAVVNTYSPNRASHVDSPSVSPAQEHIHLSRVVGGMPTRLIHPHVQARHTKAVRKHGQHLPSGWSRGHSYFVE